MDSMIKKYLPYAVTIFAIYLLVPIVFLSDAMQNFVPVAFYVVFPCTAVISSAIYCSKYGLDFLFALIAPIAYIPTMLIYYGGFNLANIILLAVYLVSGIFGLFLGDVALGDKRRKKEEEEKAEAEAVLLEAKRRDELEREKREKNETKPSHDDDDFDYDKYLSDIDKPSNASDDEVDDILKEVRSNKY